MTDSAKPLPTGQHEFEIAGRKLKKKLPAEGSKPEKAILTLALIGPDGEQGRAEMFTDTDEAKWPNVGSKETLIIAEPGHPTWAPKASRPGSGGGGRGGGRQKTPEEVAAERASIEAQVCLKAAVEVVQGDIGSLTTAAQEAAKALKAAKEMLT